jgi:type II secretory pathway pseudopilin PulG
MQRVTRMDNAHRSNRQSGFTILQMLVTVVIIAIVTTFGVLGIKNARAAMRVENSARRFAVYMEKARADSIRRHASPGNEAFIETFGEGTSTFNVRMDFDGTGTLTTRTFSLDEGVTFNTAAQMAMFDWRGRIAERLAFQIGNEIKVIPVDVSGSGDVTINDQAFSDDLIPGVTLAEVGNDVVPDPPPTPTATATATPSPGASPDASPAASPSPSPNGNGNGNGDDHGNPHSSPSPTPVASPSPSPGANPSPSPVPPPCASSVSPSSLSLSQRITSRRTGTVSFALTNAIGTHSISASTAGSGNPLTFSVSPASLSGDGSVIVTIGAKTGNGNRGNFTVNISASPTCGATQQVSVSVGN